MRLLCCRIKSGVLVLFPFPELPVFAHRSDSEREGAWRQSATVPAKKTERGKQRCLILFVKAPIDSRAVAVKL